MRLTKDEQARLKKLVRRLRDEAGAKEIYLYGSAARGELEEGSDIDLLIVLPEVTWEIEKRISGLCFEAEIEAGRVFSAICFSEHELLETPLRASPIVLAAKREGIAL